MLFTLSGCGPIVRVAPFGERPDSVKPGSLLGPFEGQVVDADSGQPLAEALVFCSWSFDRGMGTPAPEAVRAYAAQTDVDGRYLIPQLRSFPQGLTTRLARFSLVIYRKGYVGYRNDRVFGQTRARHDFSQWNNLVRLARWSPELSHAQHLLFLGGGRPLEAASEWEVLAAAAELDGGGRRPTLGGIQVTPLPTGARVRLDASALLSSDEVRTVTGYQGAFTTGRLAGERSEAYDSFHLRATDRPERYDVALRVWRPGGDKLIAKYEEILKALPGSKQNDEIADRSFHVTQGEILGLGFVDKSSETVVLLTCGRGQCTKESQLLELGKVIEKNLSKLPPPPGVEPGAEKGPASAPSPGGDDDEEGTP